MRPIVHGLAAAGLGVITYQVTKSWQLAASLAGAEVFMDIDHTVEHILWSKNPFSIRAFFESYNTFERPRMIFIFHSYEFIVLLAIVALHFANSYLWAVVFGAVAHMLMDEIGNRFPNMCCRISPVFYFFFFRFLKKFRTEAMVTFPKKRGEVWVNKPERKS